VIDERPQVTDMFIKRCFPLGINVYHAENIKKANIFFESLKFNMVILDIDPNPTESLKFLKMVTALPSKPVKVLFSSITDKNVIVPYVAAGIASYIIKPFSEEKSLAKAMEILKKISPADEKRSFYRVTPSPNEDKKVFFRLEGNSKLQTAFLLNISAGGLALNGSEEIENKHLDTGTFISKIQMKLDHQDIFLSGEVMYKKGPVFAIRLKKCSEQDLFILSKYIFNKISESV